MNKPHSPPDKRQTIAAGLLEGEAPAAIRARLVAAGVSPTAADYELKRAEKDPFATAAATLARRLAKRDWLLATLGRLRAGDATHVEKVHDIDPGEFFPRFYSANLPVVLTGLVEQWPARRLWSLDYLAAEVGDARVELQADRQSAPDYELAKERHRRFLPLREVIDAIHANDSSNDFYVTAWNDTTNKQALAALWDDLGPLRLLAPTTGRDGFFWLGPKGTLTPFHHDLTNNLLVQLVGTKRVLLVPSWGLGRMANRVHCFSALEPDDLEAAGVRPLSVEIGPGDALFLPIGWWHHVKALEASVSMSFTNFAAPNEFVAGYPADARF